MLTSETYRALYDTLQKEPDVFNSNSTLRAFMNRPKLLPFRGRIREADSLSSRISLLLSQLVDSYNIDNESALVLFLVELRQTNHEGDYNYYQKLGYLIRQTTAELGGLKDKITNEGDLAALRCLVCRGTLDDFLTCEYCRTKHIRS